MQINYHNRVFMALSNSENGQVDESVRFYYFQKDKLLYGYYEGGEIVYGQIIGKVDNSGNIEMRYQHLDQEGKFRTGICHSIPTIVDGLIQLEEAWQWTNGDRSSGKSTLIEIF